MRPFERWSVRVTSALVALSGIGYLWTKYLVSSPDPWAVVSHPLEPWFLKLHVVTAPLLVFALGLIALRHVWEHFRTGVRRGRRTGIVLVGSLFPMVVTGYLIPVVTAEPILRSLALIHIGSGLVFALAVGAHLAAVARGARTAIEGAVRPRERAPLASSGVRERVKGEGFDERDPAQGAVAEARVASGR